ncbi:MAG: Crp/Fnr family transcriptional regulator [Bacteroidota bacterium]
MYFSVTMYDNLLAHIRKYVPLDETEAETLLSFVRYRQVKKKEHLLKEGQICTANYFVLNGCLRLYVVNNKGVEQSIQFAIDHWWLSDYNSFDGQTPSGFHIQAVENSDIAFLDKTSQEQLLKKLPQLESYFRILFQRAYAASLMRVQYIFCFTKEERYHHFNKRFPEFVQRIPQYMLASFLGFTPEFLSKTRAKDALGKSQPSTSRE